MNNIWSWLGPGTHIKRWLLLSLVSITFVGLGIGLLLADAYRVQPFPPAAFYVTLQFVPRLWRGLLAITLGLGLGIMAFIGLNRSLIGLLVPTYRGNVADLLRSRRLLARGPRITVIGGGTGLSSLLRGLKEHTANIAAIVTVADDGGSSGRLRRELGVLPPGDARQCITALADAEPLVSELFEYRFKAGSAMEGHSFGNLFIAAMADITGNFEYALTEVSRVLAVRGRILPSTLQDAVLIAEYEDGVVVRGESRIARPESRIKRISLEPSPDTQGKSKEPMRAYDEAIRAILDCDMIVVGPGSLYTSLLPNLLLPEIVAAISASRAPTCYVCNVASEPGATDGYSVADHLDVIRNHVGRQLFDVVLVNDDFSPALRPEWGVSRPTIDEDRLAAMGIRVVSADLVDSQRPTRHNPEKLGGALLRLLRGPSVRRVRVAAAVEPERIPASSATL